MLSGVTNIKNTFIGGLSWLVWVLAPFAANADLATLQEKYAGVVINGTTLSKKQIEAIYLGVGDSYPFKEFDALMATKSAIAEIEKNCEGRFRLTYNYICDMGNGVAKILIKNNKVREYRLEVEMADLINALTYKLVSSRVPVKEQRIVKNLIVDLSISRFNDLSPSHIKYFTDNDMMVIEGVLKQ